MKPLYLEIQAFGPYVEKQTVDFEKLGEKGIFLIKGNTGSGKTTIFDAMTFALFGGGTGDNDKTRNGRNDLEEWRCTQADEKTDTIVSFTFSVREHRYRFTRSLTQKRINLSSKFEAGEIDDEGNIIPFFDNPKKDDLTHKAEELIGLTKEQFRQVVLLPQGQFERFLTAPSKDKEDILQKIFGSEQWTKYAQAFYDEANNRKNVLDEEMNEISRSLSEEKLETVDELEQKIADLKNELKILEEKHTAFDGEEKQKKLNEDIMLSHQFDSLHDTGKKLAELKNNKDNIDKKRCRHAQAEKAEKVRAPLDAYEKADGDKKSRKNTLDELSKKLPATKKKKEDAEKAKKEHDDNSPVEELNKQIGLYESKKDAYESIEPLRKAAKDAEKNLITAKGYLKTAEETLSATTETAKKLKDRRDSAEEIAKVYRNRYYAGIYGEIAGELREGEKCPVCGSISHPQPAVKLPDSVSKAALEEKEKELEYADKSWKAAETKRENAEKNRNDQKTETEKAQLHHTKVESDFKNAADNLIEGIADITALSKAVNNCKDQLTQYEINGKKLQTALNEASENLTKLDADIKTAKEEYSSALKKAEKAGKELDTILRANGIDDCKTVKEKLLTDEERNKLHTEIVSYETSLENAIRESEEKRNELKGKTEPNKSEFENRQSEITDERSSFIKKSTEITTTVKRLEPKLKGLKKSKAHYDKNIRQAESDLAFARKLRGDTRIGLQRYVLAIMFNQVIAEANRMLSKVHGGRYHLFRTDDKGNGNKRGLELKVHDNRSPEREGRSVGMLSGGEKFLVSLALSIGMSAVAQKSGVQIEALFIDEGFGTLDDSSINDAMDVLDSVRKGTGTIGIISHVRLLEANIPTHLEVIKKESGSTITVI